VSGSDPLNLAGILIPGVRIPAMPGNRVAFRDGIPLAAVDGRQMRLLADLQEGEQAVLDRLLDERPSSAFDGEGG
jgi:ATP-dependent Lhr-like helicase